MQVEVESCLFSHPDILEAAVVARPDDNWGEVPMAFVTLKENLIWHEGFETELIAYSRDHLAHFKCPKYVVHLVEGLPKTTTGKIQKVELRVLAKAAAASSSEK
jgi:fatty-acyl-CoA synthase